MVPLAQALGFGFELQNVCVCQGGFLASCTAGLKSQDSPPGIFLKRVFTSWCRQPTLNCSLSHGLPGRSL